LTNPIISAYEKRYTVRFIPSYEPTKNILWQSILPFRAGDFYVYFFEKNHLWCNTPHFIANTIEELMFERKNSGVETTPDETSLLIEGFYKWVARLWIAEALHAETNHPNLFVDIFGQGLLRFVYDSILSGRGGTIGAWVSIARNICSFFKKKEIEPHTKGLLSLDFGTHPGDENPTSKLLVFRNEFAHGAFHAAKERVQMHYEILAQCFEDIQGLYSQKIVAVQEGHWYHCAQETTAMDPIMELEDGIYMLGENQQTMRLTGLYTFKEQVLYPIEAQSFASADIFVSDRIQVFLARYQKEKNGEIYLEDKFTQTDISIPAAVREGIHKELKKTNPLILIEAYPGTDSQHIFHHHQEFSKDCDAFFVWDIQTDDLTMSGVTFAQKIMRTIEGIIDIQPQRKKSILDNISRYLGALKKQNKNLIVFINNLHVGFKKYRREAHSVVDIYQMLIDSSISVVATIFPGQTQKGLFYDAIVPYKKDITNPSVLEKNVQLFTSSPIKKQILEAIGTNSLHLFEICDAIDEKKGQAVTFEPEIEYALWDLSPILSTKREKKSIQGKEENIRIWSLFDHSILEYIQ